MSYIIAQADYQNKKHQQDILHLMNHYAQDIMGGGQPLTNYTQDNLLAQLAQFPGAFSVLSYDKEKAVGLINCFTGFSTFKCKPLVNIHDVIVLDGYRAKGISQAMLRKVEEVAKSLDCCKLTLEVLEGNRPAKKAYANFGFNNYTLDQTMGTAIFLEKTL